MNKSEELNPETIFLYAEQKELLSKILEFATEDCKKVLLRWAQNYRMKEIASEMHYKSEDYAKRKKHLCLKKLVEHLTRNPELKERLRE